MFLREESKERGITTVALAQRESLVQIHHATGGAPLAMKLVIGQMSRQPMDVVLNELKAARFSGQDYAFYRFVFKHSWEMLDLNAKKILVSMSVFPPGAGWKRSRGTDRMQSRRAGVLSRVGPTRPHVAG